MDIVRHLAAAVVVCFLAACGGGKDDVAGGETLLAAAEVVPAPPALPAAPTVPAVPPGHPDNGDYRVLGDTQRVLRLDFDKREWQLESDKRTGTFAPTPEGFAFLPSNSVGTSGTNTLRFSTGGGAIMGMLPTAAPSPFIAVRDYLTDFEAIQGTYLVKATISELRNEIHGTHLLVLQVTGRKLRISDAEGDLTLEGDLFSAELGYTRYGFRVARVGATRLIVLQPMAGQQFKYSGTGVDLAALLDPPPLQLPVYTSSGPGEMTLTPERYTLRTTLQDGTQRTSNGTRPLAIGPQPSAERAYLFEATEDGGSHYLSTWSTADLLMFGYDSPSWNSYFQIPPKRPVGPPPPSGFGRVPR
ncbi:MAG TPA: hypothetical protein VHL79_15295 [Ramlibacter sp.]|jgi:hypothetical protein|nr:hypothetical protein [Ramlibacter sp.]